jgi:Zn-dependent M28 family amino/carboxypeptidase
MISTFQYGKSPYVLYSQEKIYESGINVVGMLPGSFFGDSRDRPIVLAAHWDVVANTSGYNDNGSGVAAMLEVARYGKL